MKHSQIAATAMVSALHACGYLTGEAKGIGTRDNLMSLYAYCRERKFPPAETLVRKICEIVATPFPFPSLAAAPEDVRVYFSTFRAVAETLEPFYEPDPEGYEFFETALDPQPPAEDPIKVLLEITGHNTLDALVDSAKIGDSLMATLRFATKNFEQLKEWTPADDPAEIVTDLADMLDQEQKRSTTLQGQVDELRARLAAKKADMENPETIDETEQTRREGQAEMDKAIAESGGQFSQPAADEPEAKAKKKAK